MITAFWDPLIDSDPSNNAISLTKHTVQFRMLSNKNSSTSPKPDPQTGCANTYGDRCENHFFSGPLDANLSLGLSHCIGPTGVITNI
jgi:hypothetical protein